MERKDAGFWTLIFTAATVSVFVLVLLDMAFPEKSDVVKEAVSSSAARGWDSASHGVLRLWESARARL